MDSGEHCSFHQPNRNRERGDATVSKSRLRPHFLPSADVLRHERASSLLSTLAAVQPGVPAASRVRREDLVGNHRLSLVHRAASDGVRYNSTGWVHPTSHM